MSMVGGEMKQLVRGRVLQTLLGLGAYGVAGLFLILGGCAAGDSGGGPTPPTPQASVTLIVAKAGNGAGTLTSTPAGVNCGAVCTLTVSSGTVVTLNGSPAPNNTLTDWGGTCTAGSATCAVTVTANQTVTVTFNTSTATPIVTATTAGTGGGSMTCSTNGGPAGPCGTFSWGDQISITANPNGSSFFAGWSGGCSGSASPCTIPQLTADTVVTATFTILPTNPQLSVTKNGTGSGTVISNLMGINCGGICSSTFAGGAVVRLTATPIAGSTFAGWTGGGCSGTGTCDVTMNANAAVTATFNIAPVNPSLVVTTSGTGTGAVTCNGAPCNSSYPSGTSLTIVATPAATSLFGGWGGACSGFGATSTCTVTLNADSTVSAAFQLPTLSVVLAGTGTVTSNPAGINCGATCSASFSKGTSVTLTATGANFSGWSDVGCPGTGACTVILNQNKAITATFGGIPPAPVRLGAAFGYTLAAHADGRVFSIGTGMTGGSGTTLPGTAANVITGLSGISSVLAPDNGVQPNFAIAADGSVRGWGWGILGGSMTGRFGDTVNTPILVPAFGQAMELSLCNGLGVPIVYARHSDGTVSYTPATSQVAGDATRTMTTQAVPALSSVVSMSDHCSSLPYRTVVVKADGTVWTLTPSVTVVPGPSPFITTSTYTVAVAQVSGLPSITQVSCGINGDFCLARAADGTVWAWGGNTNGQLGDNTLIGRTIPIQVPGLAFIATVKAGSAESYAISTSGTVYSWGGAVASTIGILGRTTTNMKIPGVVPLTGPATALAASGTHAAVLLSNGTVWSWGANSFGEFGDGTSGTTSTTPVQAVGFSLN